METKSQEMGFIKIPQALMNASKDTQIFYRLINERKCEGKLFLSVDHIRMLLGNNQKEFFYNAIVSVEKEIKDLFDRKDINFYISIEVSKENNITTGYTFNILQYEDEKGNTDQLTFKEVTFFHDLHEFLDEHGCNISIENNLLRFHVDKKERVMPARFDVDKLHDYIVVYGTRAGEEYRKGFEALNENQKQQQIWADNAAISNGSMESLPSEAREELEKLLDESVQLYDAIRGIGKVDYLDEYPELDNE